MLQTSSIGVLINESGKERHDDYPDVKKEGPVLYIVNVVLYSFPDGGISPETVDLSPAGQTRTDLVLDVIPGDLFHELLDKLRPFGTRSHKAHVALKYVEELGKLVDAGLSDEFSDRGDPRVITLGPALLFFFHGLNSHGAELVHVEGLVMKADSLLLEDDGALAGDFYEDGYDEHQR